MSIIKVKKIVYLNFPFGGHLSRPLAYRLTGLLFLLFLANISFAKNTKVDSLLTALKTAKQDTNKVKALNRLSIRVGWRVGNYDTSFYYANEALKLSKQLSYKKGQANSYRNIGITYDIQGYHHKALKEFLSALKMQKIIKDKKGIAYSYNNIGLTYYYIGDYIKALKNYLTALAIQKKIGNKEGIATSYGNIGMIYQAQANYSKALKSYLFSLKIQRDLDSKIGIAINSNNIGIIYADKADYSKALNYYLIALKEYRKLNNKVGIAEVYGNIAMVYDYQAHYYKALNKYIAALKIQKKIGNKNGIAISYNSIGLVKLRLHQNILAKALFEKSLKLSKEMGSKEDMKISYQGLSQADRALGNYKSAYQNYKMYILYRDSLKNKANTKKITQLQMQFKFDQQQAADSIAHAKEKEIQQAQIAKQNAVIKAKQEQQYAMFGGLLLVLVFAGFMYNRFKKTQKQKKIIEIQKAETERQKQLVETKNKEISDSITYAKRIQEAILPSRFSLSESLKNGFVFFKPKDIVSGDFYWLETAPQGGAIYFAAADCTGHGVPGAMVSVVCANALSKALLEENITETGKLLDRTREIVIQQFSHSDENVKDGMDISLCKLTPSESGGGLLQWSGANNPLWIIRQNVIASPINREKQSQSNYEFTEIKGNKQPIGKTDNPKSFTTHNIELQKGDSIYIFSDGFADQFGGEEGKKFKYKPLKELLLSLQEKTMDEQKEAISQAFEQWKGNEEQVDDVCIIGVRIN